MYAKTALVALSGLALVSAQSPAAPTPTNAVVIEGDESYDGPVIPGTTGKLGNAQVVTGNPAGVMYKATLGAHPGSDVRGYVTAEAPANGEGLDFKVYLTGLPSESTGPFIYHIHAMPIPADGNCTAAGPHVDPYMRGAIPPCDSSSPATCQVGDLSGKHGNITSSPFMASYLDPYVSDVAGNKATLVGKSFVVHSYNTTRLNCANFELVSSNSTSSTNGTSTTNGTVKGSPSASVLPFSSANGAVANVASYGAVAAGIIGLAAFFL